MIRAYADAVPIRRSLPVLLSGALVLIVSAAAPAALAADDTTPPTGSIAINGGGVATNSSYVSVDVQAMDDASGIGKVELSNDGAMWSDVGLYATVSWQLPVDGANQPMPGTNTVHARFTDGVGNVSGDVTDSIVVDVVGPTSSVDILSWDPATRLLRLKIIASDAVGLGSVQVYCKNEGPVTFPFAAEIEVVLDSSIGPGCSGYGSYSVFVWVVDTAGNGTFNQTAVDVPFVVTVQYPRAAVTGQLFTIRPVYPSDFVLDPEAVCRTEFRWGSDAALFSNQSDDTFGGILFEGPASAGYCGEWTFTLPWVPVRQFNWTFTGPLTSLDETFTASVGSTDPHIATSNLPLVYVLPSSRSLTVGVPVSYTLYRLGGAGAGSQGVWVANLVGSGATTGTEIAFFQNGGSTFTFTPTQPGFWQVGWNPTAGYPWVLSGYYDPPAKRAPGTGGGASAPPAEASASPVPSSSGTDGAPTAEAPTPTPVRTDIAGPVSPSPSAQGMPVAEQPRAKTALDWAVLGALTLIVAGGAALSRPGIRRRVSSVVRWRGRGGGPSPDA